MQNFVWRIIRARRIYHRWNQNFLLVYVDGENLFQIFLCCQTGGTSDKWNYLSSWIVGKLQTRQVAWISPTATKKRSLRCIRHTKSEISQKWSRGPRILVPFLHHAFCQFVEVTVQYWASVDFLFLIINTMLDDFY